MIAPPSPLPVLSASLRHFLVEMAYLLGVHCWEHEMLEEAEESLSLYMYVLLGVFFLVYSYPNSAFLLPGDVTGDGL